MRPHGVLLARFVDYSYGSLAARTVEIQKRLPASYIHRPGSIEATAPFRVEIRARRAFVFLKISSSKLNAVIATRTEVSPNVRGVF